MKSSNHTPGPWKIVKNLDGVYAGTLSVVVGEAGEICGPRQIRTQDPNIEANMQLIALAPELLEALEAVIADTLKSDILPSVYKNAIAAIKKAKGESDG